MKTVVVTGGSRGIGTHSNVYFYNGKVISVYIPGKLTSLNKDKK